MLSASDALKRRLLGSHERRARITVLDTNLKPVAGGQITTDTIAEGQVFITSGSGPRRTAELVINNADGQYTPRNPGDLFYWGRLVRVEQGILIEPGIEQSVEWVPLGTFMIDRPSTKVSRGGITRLTLRLRDRWKLIDSAQFGSNAEFSQGSSVQTVLRNVAITAGVPSSQIIPGGTARTLGVNRPYDADDKIGEWMQSLARSFALRCYFDPYGYLVIDDVPEVSSLPVAHHYRPGDDSIITGIKRDLTDERFANHIVVATATSDPDATIVRSEAEDNRAGSPTNISTLGRRTRRFASPMITSQAIADDVAARLLSRSLRFSEETSITAVGLPYLDADDRVVVSHPNSGLLLSPYLVESIDMPILGAESSLRLTAAHDV